AVRRELREPAEHRAEEDHRERRLEDRPRGAEDGLLVANLHVAPREEVEELAVAEELARMEDEPAPRRRDDDLGDGADRRRRFRRRRGDDVGGLPRGRAHADSLPPPARRSKACRKRRARRAPTSAHVNSRARFAAASPSQVRRPGSLARPRSAAAHAPTSSGSSTSPSTWSRTTPPAPIGLTSTGRPFAIASYVTSGLPSSSEGSTNTSAWSYSAPTSRTKPTTRTSGRP